MTESEIQPAPCLSLLHTLTIRTPSSLGSTPFAFVKPIAWYVLGRAKLAVATNSCQKSRMYLSNSIHGFQEVLLEQKNTFEIVARLCCQCSRYACRHRTIFWTTRVGADENISNYQKDENNMETILKMFKVGARMCRLRLGWEVTTIR